MSGVLILGEREQKLIDEAVAKAKAKPMPLSVLRSIATSSESPTLTLAERKNPALVESVREEYAPQQLILGTYRAAISFEEQPDGMTRHLSVSSHRKDKVPGPEVVAMLVKAYGFSGWPVKRKSRMWFEEFEPGWQAINVVEFEP